MTDHELLLALRPLILSALAIGRHKARLDPALYSARHFRTKVYQPMSADVQVLEAFHRQAAGDPLLFEAIHRLCASEECGDDPYLQTR